MMATISQPAAHVLSQGADALRMGPLWTAPKPLSRLAHAALHCTDNANCAPHAQA